MAEACCFRVGRGHPGKFVLRAVEWGADRPPILSSPYMVHGFSRKGHAFHRMTLRYCWLMNRFDMVRLSMWLNAMLLQAPGRVPYIPNLATSDLALH